MTTSIQTFLGTGFVSGYSGTSGLSGYSGSGVSGYSGASSSSFPGTINVVSSNVNPCVTGNIYIYIYNDCVVDSYSSKYSIDRKLGRI